MSGIKITVIADKVENKDKENAIVNYFSTLKDFMNIPVKLKFCKSLKNVGALSSYEISDNECLFIFGSHLYRYFTEPINKFFGNEGTNNPEVFKYSYFVNDTKVNYFISFLPPIEFAFDKSDSFLSVESSVNNLLKHTDNFNFGPKDIIEHDKGNAQNKLFVSRCGFKCNTKIYADDNYNLDLFLTSLETHLTNNPYAAVALDVETNGLEIFNKEKHKITIISFCFIDGYGHAINIGLPGINSGISEATQKRIENIIFNYPKTVVAWNAQFDVFSLCNHYNKTLNDFRKNNKIVDALQLLHILNPNRQLEGYGLKAAARDIIGYTQYSFIEQYLKYLKDYESISENERIEIASNSLVYAASDAAAEFKLFSLISDKIDKHENYLFIHKLYFSNKIFGLKTDLEYNGIKVLKEEVENPSFLFEGWQDWELNSIAMPVCKGIKDWSDGRIHPNISSFGAVTGRLQHMKPHINKVKMNESRMGKYIIAEDGNMFLHIDMKQAELCMAAMVFQDYNLIDDINNNNDLYEHFAKIVYCKDEILPIERKNMKNAIISMLYLISSNSLAENLKTNTEEAKRIQKMFYTRYDKLNNGRQAIEFFINKNLYIVSPSYRHLRFDKSDFSENNTFNMLRKAYNFPIQSSASDYFISAIYDIYNRLGYKPVNFCHDSITFEIEEKSINEPNKIHSMIENLLNTHYNENKILTQGIQMFNSEVLGKTVDNIKIPKLKIKTMFGKSFDKMTEVNNA